MAGQHISQELAEALRGDSLDGEDEWEDEDDFLAEHRQWQYEQATHRDTARYRLAYLLGVGRARFNFEELSDQLLTDLEALMAASDPRPSRKVTQQIAERAVADLDSLKVYDLLRSAKWDDFSLPHGCKLKNLIKHTRPVLAERLADELFSMLTRWQVQGLLDLKHRHERPDTGPRTYAPQQPRKVDPKEREVRRSTYTPGYLGR